MKASSTGRTLWTALLVFAACYLGATVDTLFQFPQTRTAVIFPPYAILTAALLLSSPSRWWIYLAAASIGNFLPHLMGGASTSFVLLAEVANNVRALVAAIGVRRFRDSTGRFDTLSGMAVFLLFATLVAPAAGASIGACAVALHNGADQYWPAWRPWFLSNTLTGLTMLPLILITVTTARASFGAGMPRRRVIEATIFSIALLAVGGLVLLEPPTLGVLPAPLYAPLPLLLWAAVRFGPRGTSASVLIVSALAIWGTLSGRGPFVTSSPDDDLIHLQLFLFVISVPLLLLSTLIREQERTEEALRASERRYRTVVEDQTELICRFHAEGTLTFVNDACCRSLRRSSADLLGTSFWSFVPTDRRDEGRRVLAALGPERPVMTLEHALDTGEGESRWEQWRIRAIFDERLAVVDYQAVGRDISEKKRAEEGQRLLEVQQTLSETLRAADRRKDEFLAMLAHELRNPLAPISMVVEIMQARPANDEQMQWARQIIARQVGQLKRLVDDLMDVSRITSGKIQLHMATTDIAEIVSSAVETSRSLVADRSLELTLELCRAPLPARGDAVRLMQLVSNLLNNAVKYTGPGGRIGFYVTEEDSEIVLRLVDTGAGIPADMLDRVFEPFTQVNRSRDGALGGLGLGLTLVKRLAEMHGGSVQARSEGLGRGSEFIVRLPSLATSSERASKPPRQILVVDDAVDAAESLARVLELQGHEVHVAHDGVAALDKALCLGPEVVFLDLGLPKMDGLEVAKRLRTRFGSARMLLVATTGLGQNEDRRRTSEAGFDHHLVKPIDPSVVQALLWAVAPG